MYNKQVTSDYKNRINSLLQYYDFRHVRIVCNSTKFTLITDTEWIII